MFANIIVWLRRLYPK